MTKSLRLLSLSLSFRGTQATQYKAEILRDGWAELGLHETGFGELGEAVEPKRRRPPCLRAPQENPPKLLPTYKKGNESLSYSWINGGR